MTSVRVKRSQLQTFLNTGTLVSPVWSVIGDGVATAKIAYNPKLTEETYINLDNATIEVEDYAPKMPVDAVAKNGDAVFEFIDNLRKTRAILDAAETQIVNVWLYETPSMGYYLAEKQAVAISVDDFGGDGGKAAKINYTLDYIGTPVIGSFSPAGLAFVPAPVNTILSTLVIGGVTLTPLFSADNTWLWYTGSVAASSVTMSSTLTGATIVQKVGASVVSQGGAAALSMGLNHLTVQVTVGTEVTTYSIDITRTA